MSKRQPPPIRSMCPHCGEIFNEPVALIPNHDYPRPCRAVCPGSGQIPRDPYSDKRPLWNGKAPKLLER